MNALELAEVPVERIAADLLIVPLFEGERPPRGAAGRVDWRLCGRLSQLLAAGHWSEGFGQALLTPGGGGVRAAKVMGLGLGHRDQLDLARWEDWVGEALERSGRLDAGRMALAVPASAEPLAGRLARVLSQLRSKPAPEQVCLVTEADETPVAVQWFRGMTRRSQTGDIAFVLPASSGSPRGAKGDEEGRRTALQSPRSSQAPAGRFSR